MDQPLLFKVLHDTMGDRTRIRISADQISKYCTQLAETVGESYQPDFVIAVATGGTLPGELIGKALGIEVIPITIRRDINIGRMYNRDPFPLRWIMSAYHHFLFHTTRPIIHVGITRNLSGTKVLIVDDSLHTGATIGVATDYLKERGVSEIRTACITHASTMKPDYWILDRGNYSFPWSRDFVADKNDYPIASK